MNNSSSSNKSISKFIDDVIKTKEELETVPIPKLYGIPFDAFKDNDWYNVRGFLGISGLQLITSKQTIMDEYPVIVRVMHWKFYNHIFHKIYSGEKLERMCQELGRNSYINLSSSKDYVNHISLRYVNNIGDNNGEIDVTNFCVIYGNLNNINSYQKRILLESVTSILEKDSSILIYHYDSEKEIGISDIIAIIPHDEIVLDEDEKLLSSEDTEYVRDIVDYRSKSAFDHFYVFEQKLKCIIPFAKFNIPNYERLTEYGVKILDAKTMNEMIINKVRIERPCIISDPELIYPGITEGQSHSR